MIHTVENPRFDINEVLKQVNDERTEPYFANYWQRIFGSFARTLNLLISSRNTGVTGAIATGAVINHGMPVAPKFVTLIPQDATPTAYFVDTITKTQFTVHYTGGGTHAFGWTAET